MKQRPLGAALIFLLWFHSIRHIAMQIFSAADVGGLEAAERTIAYGDLATAVLAVLAIVALHKRLEPGRYLAWVVAIVGTADLISASVAGIGQELTETATDFSWFILAFIVPILWVTSVMLFWQLYTRRTKPLYPKSGSATSQPT